MADSRLLVGARPVAMIRAACAGSSRQLSLLTVGNGLGPVQFQDRVSQRVWDTEACQGRPNGPEQDMFRSASGDDEAANANVVARLNEHARREVERLRRSWRHRRNSRPGGSSGRRRLV